MEVKREREIISITLNDDKKTITVKFRIKLESGFYIIVDRVFNIEDYEIMVDLYGEIGDLYNMIDVCSLSGYIYNANVDLTSGVKLSKEEAESEDYNIISRKDVEEKIKSFLNDLLEKIMEEMKRYMEEEFEEEIEKPKSNERGR